jgi:hypothetical protein
MLQTNDLGAMHPTLHKLAATHSQAQHLDPSIKNRAWRLVNEAVATFKKTEEGKDWSPASVLSRLEPALDLIIPMLPVALDPRKVKAAAHMAGFDVDIPKGTIRVNRERVLRRFDGPNNLDRNELNILRDCIDRSAKRVLREDLDELAEDQMNEDGMDRLLRHVLPSKHKKTTPRDDKAPQNRRSIIMSKRKVSDWQAQVDARAALVERAKTAEKEAKKQRKLAAQEEAKQVKAAASKEKKQAKAAAREKLQQSKVAEKEAAKQAKLAQKKAGNQGQAVAKALEEAKLAAAAGALQQVRLRSIEIAKDSPLEGDDADCPLCGVRASELKKAKLRVAWSQCRHCMTQWCAQCLAKEHLEVHERTCASSPPLAPPATPTKKKRKPAPESVTPDRISSRAKKAKIAYTG